MHVASKYVSVRQVFNLSSELLRQDSDNYNLNTILSFRHYSSAHFLFPIQA
jgi:hypothetical protein